MEKPFLELCLENEKWNILIQYIIQEVRLTLVSKLVSRDSMIQY